MTDDPSKNRSIESEQTCHLNLASISAIVMAAKAGFKLISASGSDQSMRHFLDRRQVSDLLMSSMRCFLQTIECIS